jgi:hypothetical protein
MKISYNHTAKDQFYTKSQKYGVTKNWFFHHFLRKGVGLPISMILFLEVKSLQEN